MKEWFLAVKLEKVLSKDEILGHYLNEAPYGGSVYGVETASEMFFGKKASEVTLAEGAYLSAIPNAPSLFSPYGSHVDRLNERKDLVLRLMHEQGYITDAEYTQAKAEVVVFRPKKDQYAKAIHFVEYVRSYLEEKYGKDMVENEGLDVITTLNWELQEKAEEIVLEEALKNEKAWDASNMGLVAIDPTTGQILSIVGSRDYSDPLIDGKFNITLANRQPGSSFKPIVYVTGFQKGYTDATILFDVPTQFASGCRVDDFSDHNPCYSPKDYDGKFLGPMTVRDALAQSRNVPAVKMLYLVGVNNALMTAKSLGIDTLLDANQYGLTLVLGGGEVNLLQMTSAYGVFANDGVRLPATPILKVTDKKGTVLEEYKNIPVPVLDAEAVRTLNSVLSDNSARAPLFGSNSFLYFGDRYDVAGKTGTTNNNRDAWLIGYSPSLVVGVWSGNNDNSAMKKGSSISGGAWRRYMDAALPTLPNKRFIPPAENAKSDLSLKPILRGVWAGGQTVTIDTVSGKLATEFTPSETRDELIYPNPHSILHWVDKNDPRGPIPDNPATDRQYEQWEYGARNWIANNGVTSGAHIITDPSQIPTKYDDIHTAENAPEVKLMIDSGTTFHPTDTISIMPSVKNKYPLKSMSIFLNNTLIGSTENQPFSYNLIPCGKEYTGKPFYD
jgi:membrane peptidoglycan carboxypeptidase